MKAAIHLPSAALILVLGAFLAYAVAGDDGALAIASGAGLVGAIYLHRACIALLEISRRMDKLIELLQAAKKIIRDQNPEEYDAIAKHVQAAQHRDTDA